MVWNQVPTFKRDQAGRIMVNPERQFVKPFMLPTDAPQQVMTIPAGGRSGPASLTARWDGPIEVFTVHVTVGDEDGIENFLTDYNLRVFIEAPGKRKNLMQRPINLIGMAGCAGRPLCCPKRFSSQIRRASTSPCLTMTRKSETWRSPWDA